MASKAAMFWLLIASALGATLLLVGRPYSPLRQKGHFSSRLISRRGCHIDCRAHLDDKAA